ncbi:alpha/beta hydrolase [Catenuloplanes atrovinosus]|uniref:Acetyl esterase/lipase n=1 Tax=Catenuloplanes atrovinosus TaxID=137266 RepID=A0AAE3YKX5_9ACTN|nr:alpha/beta hydrolase [Catenuloplanes atrovinosus]MDR7274186.1 acetyl esterase/lipase [Catenuloplanes atrovinosus]
MRASYDATAGEDLSVFDVVRRDIGVDGHRGAALAGTVFGRPDHTGTGPGVFVLHDGGNRFTGLSLILPLLAAHDVVVVTVDRRLPPEHPDPYPVEDAYAALTWTARNGGDLGIDPGRLVLAGIGAGGGPAAGTALLARDRGGPALLGQLLIDPMLDDRDRAGGHHRHAWSALLGARAGTSDVSPYAAPARAWDLSGLPPAFVDVDADDVVHDEATGYASRIRAEGGAAESHVRPGGTPAADRAAAEARSAWLGRLVAATTPVAAA